MADERLLSKHELDMAFADILTASAPGLVQRAVRLLRQHIEAQAERIAELEAEMDAILYAAHMPEDYEFGLPSWINQHLYGELVMLRDADGGPVRRSEDIEKMQRLFQEAAIQAERIAELEADAKLGVLVRKCDER